MNIKRNMRSSAVVLLLVGFFGAGDAWADKRGEELMACVDKNPARSKDQYFVYDMIIADPGQSKPLVLGMKVWIKDGMRLVHFISPADVKGMKILSRSRAQMYVYLKGYNRIRRITSHMKRQTLFGADYNYDDQMTLRYGDLYLADYTGEEGEIYKLKMKRRPGSDAVYGAIEMKIRKKDCYPLEMRYLDEKGRHLKTETRSSYTCQANNICEPTELKMVSHVRNNHWTKIVRKEWKVNSGLSKRLFTRRALQRN
ncbi:MAG: outer membrane lipoprotein-sorting protein [Deltaproteobacteria bacterium]|nr:outer membrane lipoprotein-sorting protein [Deltaproteobacteria bacterium]